MCDAAYAGRRTLAKATAPTYFCKMLSILRIWSRCCPRGPFGKDTVARGPTATVLGWIQQMGARDRVTETLRAVFSRHGAVASTSAAIGLATDEASLRQHAASCYPVQKPGWLA